MRNGQHTLGGRQQIHTWLLLLTLPMLLKLENALYSHGTPPGGQAEMQFGHFQCRMLCGMDGEEAEAPHLPSQAEQEGAAPSDSAQHDSQFPVQRQEKLNEPVCIYSLVTLLQSSEIFS